MDKIKIFLRLIMLCSFLSNGVNANVINADNGLYLVKLSNHQDWDLRGLDRKNSFDYTIIKESLQKSYRIHVYPEHQLVRDYKLAYIYKGEIKMFSEVTIGRTKHYVLNEASQNLVLSFIVSTTTKPNPDSASK